MRSFKFAPEVKIGTIFTRVDKNGKVWTAEVVDRTEYFVDVKKIQPYKRKVVDDCYTETKFYNGKKHTKTYYLTHEEDAEPTYERAQINEMYHEEETDEVVESIWGTSYKKIKVKENRYTIHLKEEYSKYSQYDKVYQFNF